MLGQPLLPRFSDSVRVVGATSAVWWGGRMPPAGPAAVSPRIKVLIAALLLSPFSSLAVLYLSESYYTSAVNQTGQNSIY